MKLSLPLKLGIFVVLLFSAVMSAGCAYMKNRALDFTEIFVLEGHFGPGLGAGVRVSEYVGCYIGAGQSDVIYLDLREKLNVSEEFGFIGLGPIGGMEINDKLCEFTLADYHASLIGPIRFVFSKETPPPIRYADVSAFAQIGIIGFRIGISLGELGDFLLGWTTLDIAGDDKEPEEKSNEE